MIFIGIDSGTQSTKAIAIDLDGGGEVIASAQEGYGLIEGLPDGHLEQHPHTWRDAASASIEKVCAQLGDRRAEVRGIGVSGQQHGLAVLDGAGKPVRAAKLWCDTSTTDQCAQFAAEFGSAEGLIAMAGNTVLPGFTIPKLLWLKQNEPENFAATKLVLLPHDYLNYWLTGIARMEYGDASGTGVLDVRTRTWKQELLDFVDPSAADMFPDLKPSLEPCGELLPNLASKWGLPEGVIISSGGGDNMMGAIGTGNVTPGVVTASFGTSGTLYGYADSPMVDPKGEVSAFCDSTDGWMPLVCTMNVTVVTEQVRKMFDWDLSELEQNVKAAPVGADGLTFLPYLTGERTPNLPGGSGVLHGMKLGNTSPAHIARAAMEGATLGLAYGLRRFRELGMSPSEVRLTGGGSKSAAWRQIAADAFDAEVVCLQTAEGAGLGSAIQAAHAYLNANGDPTSYTDLCAKLVQLDESSRCTPDRDNAETYSAQLDHQLALTADLAEKGHL